MTSCSSQKTRQGIPRGLKSCWMGTEELSCETLCDQAGLKFLKAMSAVSLCSTGLCNGAFELFKVQIANEAP